MTYTCFDVEIADKIARLTLKRGAEFNSMTPDFWRELPQIIRDIDNGAKARVIVIASTGKHFCAGMDLSVFTSGQSAGAAAAVSNGRARPRARQFAPHDSRIAGDFQRARTGRACRFWLQCKAAVSARASI